jgi:virginiamycin B lyase
MKTRVLSLITVFACLTPELRSQTTITTDMVFRSLKEVAVAGNGIMYGLAQNGQIHGWDGRSWRLLDGELMQMSVGSKNEIWGVNKLNQVWRANTAGWQQLPGLLKQVAVAKGGGTTVVGIDVQDKPVIWNGTGWIPLRNPQQDPPALKQIAMGPTQIYGIGVQDEIHRWRPNSNPSLSRWVRIKGSLKSISVGTDGSIGGVNTANKAWVRKDSDVEVELSAPAVEPNWTALETPAAGIVLIDEDTSMLLDSKGLMVQRGVPWHEFSDQVLVLPDSELKVTYFVPEIKYVAGPIGNVPVTGNGCVYLSGTLKLDVPQAQDSNIVVENYNCKIGTFTNVQEVPQVPASNSVATPAGAWFWFRSALAAAPTEKAAGISDKRQATASSALANQHYWVAREKKAMTQNGPLKCAPRVFRNVSHRSWVEFQLPPAREFEAIVIPAGAYNNYVLPACNRVWWDTLGFVCTADSGWKLMFGRYDADAFCHGSPGNSPYVEYGDR